MTNAHETTWYIAKNGATFSGTKGMTLTDDMADAISDKMEEYHGLNGDEVGDQESRYSAEELDSAYIAGYRQALKDMQDKATRRA